MIKIRKPRINTIIIISMIIFVCIIGFYFTSRVIKTIFFEENTAKSSFDEIFVDENDSIVLESLDLTEVQSEILIYISEWKEVCGLSYINVYLDSNLEISTVVFVYQLDDIDNYIGSLEVKCVNEDENWEIVRAESVYYYDEGKSPNNSKIQLKDSLLIQKIQAVVEFIVSKENPRVDLYLIKISGNSIRIDAHNMENKESQNNWREDCLVYQKGSDVFVELESDN